MRAWTLEPSAPARAAREALSAVVAQIGRPGFAEAALAPLGRTLGAGSWAVYRLWPDAPPSLHLSASHRIRDTTGDCFTVYRDDGLYRHDTSFDAVRHARRFGEPMLLRMPADEAPNEAHRDAIYRRHGMLERLTVARVDDDRSVLALNVYHHGAHGLFDEAQVERFAELAPTLLAAVVRHVEWMAGADAGHRAMLRRRCPALTGRELDVLERLLAGLTYEGVATDLGLRLASVKTYRARAFERLGLHYRSQLHALVRANPVDLSGDSAPAVAP